MKTVKVMCLNEMGIVTINHSNHGRIRIRRIIYTCFGKKEFGMYVVDEQVSHDFHLKEHIERRERVWYVCC